MEEGRESKGGDHMYVCMYIHIYREREGGRERERESER
jgi:hypothetical protein